MKTVELCTRWILSVFLFVSGTQKWISGYSDSYLLSEWLFWTLSALEICGGFLLAGRFASVVSVLAFMIGGAGVAIAFVFPDETCGCLGSTVTTRWGHVLLGSALATVASLHIAVSCGPTRAEGTQN